MSGETTKQHIIQAMKEGAQHPIVASLNFMGGVSGAISLLTIIFMGGSIVQEIKDLRRDVEEMRSAGSVTVREHIKQDEAEDAARLQRIVVLEEAVKRLVSIEKDVAEIKTTIRLATEPRPTLTFPQKDK